MLRSTWVLLLAFAPGCSIYIGGRAAESSHSVAVVETEHYGAQPHRHEHDGAEPHRRAHPYPATAEQPASSSTPNAVATPAEPTRTAATPRTRPRASSRPERPIDRVVGTRGDVQPRGDLIPVASGGGSRTPHPSTPTPSTSTPTPSTSTPTPSTPTPSPSTPTPSPSNPTTRPATRPNPNVWSRGDRDLRVSGQRREIKPLTRVCAACPEHAVTTPSDRVRPALQR